jgi:hypothetical protein
MLRRQPHHQRGAVAAAPGNHGPAESRRARLSKRRFEVGVDFAIRCRRYVAEAGERAVVAPEEVAAASLIDGERVVTGPDQPRRDRLVLGRAAAALMEQQDHRRFPGGGRAVELSEDRDAVGGGERHGLGGAVHLAESRAEHDPEGRDGCQARTAEGSFGAGPSHHGKQALP